MRVQFNYVFDRKNKVKKLSQKGLLELRAYQNPKTKWTSTKIKVKKEEWNEVKQEIKITHPDADDLNIQLRKLKNDINDKQTEFLFKDKPFTLDDVKAHFKNKRLKTSSFIVFIKEEIALDASLKPKTKTQHNNTIKKILEFKGNNDVLFNDISHSFAYEFINYLRSQKLAVNTVHKHNKNLKKYINMAINTGFIDIPNPCKSLKVKSEQKPRDVLTEAELATVENLKFEKQDHKFEQVRDMFLFACYTGLRISDVCALKPEDIKFLEKGLELNFFTAKVNKHAVLPLYILFPVKDEKSKPEQILIKYLSGGQELVFPKLPEAFINRYLKVIASDAKIAFNLTFHIGRETFGTYMANKVPLGVLMKLLQHSDIKTTMLYVHINEQMVKDQLIKVDWN